MKILRRKTPVVFAAIIAASVFGLSACSPSSVPAPENESEVEPTPDASSEAEVVETATIRMHVYPGALLSLPTYVAEAEGIFEKYGLVVEQLSFASGPEATQAAVSGGVDFVDTSLSVVNIANENFEAVGSPRKLLGVVGGVAKNLHYSIVGRAGIDWPDPSDQDAVLDALEDKTIGVTVVGADTQNVFMGLMELTGRDPSKANFVGVGIGASAVAAVTSGQVDALVSAPPAGERIVSEGGTILVDWRQGNVHPAFEGMPQTLYFASNVWLEENPEVAVRVQNAFKESMEFLQDPNNLDRVTEIYVGESEGLEFDSAREAVANYVGLFTPYMPCAGIEKMNDFYINYTNTFKQALPCEERVWDGAGEFLVK